MKEQQLTNEESLALIGRMISQAKSNYSSGVSFFFLLWGWVVALANFGHYILAHFHLYDKPYIVWFITIPAVLVSIYYGIKMDRETKVTTHLDRLYGHVWLALGVVMTITIIFMSRLDYNHNAIILLLAGTGTYINGKMLKFTPLVLGSVALIGSAIICFTLSVNDQYLVAGIGILAGYLVPGYILKSKESE